MEQLFNQYGFWALLTYVLVRDGIPLINKWFPYLDKNRERKIKVQAEEQDRKADQREREIVAVEMIGKAFIENNGRLTNVEQGMRTVIEGLQRSNESLAVLLDRVNGKRSKKVMAGEGD